jgi:hypothetical protein
MLRTNCTKDMTNLTMLTADKHAGIALTILIISQTKEGKELLSQSFIAEEELNLVNNNMDVSNSSSSNAGISNNDRYNYKQTPQITYVEFVQVLESLLSFHAWYKSQIPIQWKHDSKSIIKHSIITMLEMLKKVLPRATRNRWKLQKFHEHLHIPDNIEMFGLPKNFVLHVNCCAYLHSIQFFLAHIVFNSRL